MTEEKKTWFVFVNKEMEPDLIQNSLSNLIINGSEEDDFGPNLIRIKITDQIRELQTVLRDK